jgi:hypothetical protein
LFGLAGHRRKLCHGFWLTLGNRPQQSAIFGDSSLAPARRIAAAARRQGCEIGFCTLQALA